ncbi:MAG: sensor histidine kinase [Gaiellaceae bacterium]
MSTRSERLSPELVRLRWLATAAPIAVLALAGYLLQGPVHDEFHHFPGYLYVLLVLAAAVSAFSFAIFGLIGRLEREIFRRNRQLAALLAVGRAEQAPGRLSDVLEAALDALVEATAAGAAEVWLIEDGRPVLSAGRGEPDVPMRSLPIQRGEERLGLLRVAQDAPGAEERLLEGIAEQIALAVENARLHARVLDRAVLEERERIARELHDGLAQVLGYVNTQTVAIRTLLSSGRLGDAEAELAVMEIAARHAYRDVRQAILGLRRPRQGLIQSLREYLADYGLLAGTELRLDVADGAELAELPETAEIQLLRIVQEAVANVRKHARAGQATVTLSVEGDRLRVEIADDGRGFAPGSQRRTGWPHFGIQTMRERAEAIGGLFEIVSAPGEGTRVVVDVPVEARWETRHARLAG